MTWPDDVRRADLRVDVFRSGGPGGQNQNKVSSGVRITHLPTGLSATSREHRDQPANKKAAFLKLIRLLVPLMREHHLGPEAERERAKKSLEVVRSYDLERHRVRDYRLDGSFDFERVLDGDDLGKIQNLVLLAASED